MIRICNHAGREDHFKSGSGVGEAVENACSVKDFSPEKTKFKLAVCNSGVPCEKRVPSCFNPELRDNSASAVSVESSADVVTRLRSIR